VVGSSADSASSHTLWRGTIARQVLLRLRRSSSATSASSHAFGGCTVAQKGKPVEAEPAMGELCRPGDFVMWSNRRRKAGKVCAPVPEALREADHRVRRGSAHITRVARRSRQLERSESRWVAGCCRLTGVIQTSPSSERRLDPAALSCVGTHSTAPDEMATRTPAIGCALNMDSGRGNGTVRRDWRWGKKPYGVSDA
jgi:hypothetical protein